VPTRYAFSWDRPAASVVDRLRIGCGSAIVEGMSEALPPPPGIGVADWASTALAVRILVLAFQQQVVRLSERVGAEVGLGSIAALEQQMRAALAAPMGEAHAFVREQPVANVDETSWREQTQRCWLWVAVSALVTVFLVRPSRGSTSAKELLGTAYAGVVGLDRWSGYTWLANSERQVCWTHLVRDFTALVERGGGSKALGTACLDVADRLFALWCRVRDGTLDRATFTLLVTALQAELHALLTTGLARSQAKTRHLCQTLLKVEAALWTFVTVGDVEPTNNAAERAVRRAVLWRRRRFGTQSAAGSRFVERVLTAVTTLRQQERDVLDYLADATQAALLGAPAPSLLPTIPALAAPSPATLPLAA